MSGLFASSKNFASLAVHQLADGYCAFQVGNADFHLGYARLHEFLVKRFAEALVRAHESLAGLRMANFAGELAVNQTFRSVPEHRIVAKSDALDLIERAQHVFIRLHSQRAQENRAQELALAVDADVQNILGVVLEFHP